MNRTLFYKINTVFGDNYLTDDYCNELYDYYVYGGKVFSYDVNISSTDFNNFFSIIYDKIGSKISVDDFKKISLQFVQLMMGEARVGKVVNIDYFVSNIFYFGFDSEVFKDIRKDVKLVKKSFDKSKK